MTKTAQSFKEFRCKKHGYGFISTTFLRGLPYKYCKLCMDKKRTLEDSK